MQDSREPIYIGKQYIPGQKGRYEYLYIWPLRSAFVYICTCHKLIAYIQTKRYNPPPRYVFYFIDGLCRVEVDNVGTTDYKLGPQQWTKQQIKEHKWVRYQPKSVTPV